MVIITTTRWWHIFWFNATSTWLNILCKKLFAGVTRADLERFFSSVSIICTYKWISVRERSKYSSPCLRMTNSIGAPSDTEVTGFYLIQLDDSIDVCVGGRVKNFNSDFAPSWEWVGKNAIIKGWKYHVFSSFLSDHSSLRLVEMKFLLDCRFFVMQRFLEPNPFIAL